MMKKPKIPYVSRLTSRLVLRNFNLYLGIILLLALVVRMWGVGFGLPQQHMIDERWIIYSAFYAALEKLRPVGIFHSPPFMGYILLVEYGIYFLLGRTIGVFSSTSEFAVSYLKDPTTFILIGRVTMVLAGVFSVWLVWFLGKKYFSKLVGILASFFLSLNFLHVKESHYIKPDVLSGLLILASFYFALRIVVSGERKNYLWAGIFAGLAIGTRFPSGLILLVVVVAHFIKSKTTHLNKLLVAFGSSALAFVLVHPYFVLEFSSTLQSVYRDFVDHALIDTSSITLGRPVWWYFLTEHIPQGVGFFMFVTAIGGFILSLWKGRKKKQYLLIPILPVVFFLTIDSWSNYDNARYAVMTLPFFTLGSAVFVESLYHKLYRRRVGKAFVIILGFVLIWQPLLRIVKFDRLISTPDTREISEKWIEENIEAGEKILVEGTYRPEYASTINAALDLDILAIDKELSIASRKNFPARYLNFLRKANEEKRGYKVVVANHLNWKTDLITNQFEVVDSVEFYLEEGVKYVVVSSWVDKSGLSLEFRQSFEDNYELIQSFSPSYEFPVDPHFIRMDYGLLERVDPFKKDLTFGPKIEIYQRRS